MPSDLNWNLNLNMSNMQSLIQLAFTSGVSRCYTLCLKIFFSCNLRKHCRIFIFGIPVTEKVSNQ